MIAATRKKYIRMLPLLCLMLFLSAVSAAAQTGFSWVRDMYSLFSDSETETLEQMCRDFYDRNGIPVFILTADNATVGGSADSSTVAYIEDFADRYVDGDCVGLIINMETRYLYLDVKCDQEETRRRLTDSRQKEIHDAIYSRLSAGDWYGGAKAFINTTDKMYNLPAGTDGGSGSGESRGLYAGICALLAAVCTGVTYSARASRHREKHIAVSAEPYVVGGEISLTKRADDFVRHYTTRVKIESESHGGGTSTHTSSGGHTHSGGGSHF